MDDGIIMKKVKKDMLGAVTQINHSLAAISVGDHSTELIICKRISVTAPVVVLLFLQLLFQLLKNIALVLLLKYYSLNCKRLANNWKVMYNTIHCKHEGREKHNACKFQIAVDVVFQKAVDPAVVTATSDNNIRNGCCICRCSSS